MFAKNEGTLDRVIRFFVGTLALVGALFLSVPPAFTVILWIIAVGGLFTAVSGFCGLYSLLGIRTCPMKKS